MMTRSRDRLTRPARYRSLGRRVALLASAALTLGAVSLVPATQRVAASTQAAGARQGTSLSGTIVVDWNKTLIKILATPGAQPATIHPTRSLAILHAAIYDAVDSITHSSPSYLFSIDAASGARPDAAAAEAGHDVLASLYPSQKSALDQQLAAELAGIPDGSARQQGIAVGHLAALFLLAARSDDGSSVTPAPFPPGTQPGEWRPAPPAFAPGAFPNWGSITPFVLQSGSQFRPGPPPSLTSAAYAQAINEVKSLGQDTSTTRTADQAVTAKFWAPPIWITWNEIAERSALAHHTNLVTTARLFALLNLSFADTAIAFYDAKYFYHLWRPVTAIREAASAGNPAVTADTTWNPLVPTANDPSYPGAHSAISGAGAAVLTSFFGKHDHIQVTSDALPGVVRSFDSYDAAATEAGLSRIYAGVHTRLDHVSGLKLGQDVAAFVLKQAKSRRFGLRRG